MHGDSPAIGGHQDSAWGYAAYCSCVEPCLEPVAVLPFILLVITYFKLSSVAAHLVQEHDACTDNFPHIYRCPQQELKDGWIHGGSLRHLQHNLHRDVNQSRCGRNARIIQQFPPQCGFTSLTASEGLESCKGS